MAPLLINLPGAEWDLIKKTAKATCQGGKLISTRPQALRLLLLRYLTMGSSRKPSGLSKSIRVRCGNPRSVTKHAFVEVLPLNKSTKRLAQEARSRRDQIAGK
jgi:hypothetical protein